jgi:hypothetical protein
VAANQWWRGRGRSNSGEDRGEAGQRVAQVASQGPRERTEAVGWLGKHAGSRARRRLADGGRGEITPASWRLGQTNQRAQELQGFLKEWGAARVGEEKQAGWGSP